MYKKDEISGCEVAENLPIIRAELAAVQDEINRLEKSVQELMGILHFVSRDEEGAEAEETNKKPQISCEMVLILHTFVSRLKLMNARITRQLSILEI